MSDRPTAAEGTRTSLWRGSALGIALLAFIVVPFVLWGAQIEAWAAAAMVGGRVAVGMTGAALLAADIVLPIPSSIVAVANGALLGGLVGTFVNAAGLTIGCLLGIALGRSGAKLAEQVLGPRGYRAFAAWIARGGMIAIMLCRAVPVLAEASILAAGAGRIAPRRAIVAATVADLALGAAYAFAGAAEGPAAAPAVPALAAAIVVPALAAAILFAVVRRTRTRSGN